MSDSSVARELLRARGSLFAFILSLVRDFDLAEELFQEVSVRILERKDSFVPGTDFGAWAREFARRTMREVHRLRGRLVLSPGAMEAVERHFAEAAEQTESSRRRALDDCLTQVNEQARRLLDLRYSLGKSIGQIAHDLRRSAGAVQVALSRIRGRLRECMRKRMVEEGTA